MPEDYNWYQDDPNKGWFDTWGKEDYTTPGAYGPMTSEQYKSGGAYGQSGDAYSGMFQDNPETGMFDTWNQQSTANLTKGVGTAANIYFGYKNLGMAKDNLKMKKEQHNLWKEDRLEDKVNRAKVSAIRF